MTPKDVQTIIMDFWPSYENHTGVGTRLTFVSFVNRIGTTRAELIDMCRKLCLTTKPWDALESLTFALREDHNTKVSMGEKPSLRSAAGQVETEQEG